MVREAIISAATLAGLVGLACFYNNGSAPSRMPRAADDFADVDFNFQADADDVFADDFNMDVDMFADDQEQRAGAGAKKQISQVKNCVKNAKCIARAQEMVKSWSANSEKYILANPSRLLKSVNTGFEENESDLGMCTPNDDALSCDGDSEPLAHYNANENMSPKETFSVNADVQAVIDSYGESSAMASALDSMSASAARDSNNAFRSRAAKIFLIIPNGVPMSMPESYNYRFGNYWRWFKAFNQKYIGVGPKGAQRVNFHFWFLRQDKNLKVIMKTPAKSSNRFPWKRFDSIMLPNQNTAAQPKLTGTFQALWNTIDGKGMSADFTEGQDCFTIWFHQYVPADILDLSDSLFQEETMKNLEAACTIIHVWVGMAALGDTSSVKVVQYVQGLLQPEQLATTSADPQGRRYYFVNDLQDLMGPAGNRLMDSIYNDISFERARATCLLATGATDLGAAFEAANDRYDEYYSYGDDQSTTTNAYGLATSAGAMAYDVSYDVSTTEGIQYDETSTAAMGPPDYKCCGIGFSGKKYDSNAEACCDDGSIAASEADCFLL